MSTMTTARTIVKATHPQRWGIVILTVRAVFCSSCSTISVPIPLSAHQSCSVVYRAMPCQASRIYESAGHKHSRVSRESPSPSPSPLRGGEPSEPPPVLGGGRGGYPRCGSIAPVAAKMPALAPGWGGWRARRAPPTGWLVVPLGRLCGAGAGCTPVSTGVPTVTLACPLTPPCVATTCALPAPFAVPFPVASTPTTPGASLVHATAPVRSAVLLSA